MHSRPTCRLSPLLRAMPRLRVLAVLLAALPLAATARIEAPDHVIYGNATVFGNPVAAGTLVEVRSAVSDALLARYPLGRNPRLGGQFALNIPMDTVEPRIAGRARAGDPVRIFVGNQLAAETSVGEEGVAVRLDVDPQFMGTGPALQISDVDMPEGNDGMSVARFDLSMNTTSNQTVSVEWTTQDGSASGGLSCTGGVDYVTDAGTASIAPGGLTASIEVLVCGDTDIEDNETFTVQLSGLQNAVLANPEGEATLRDDDNVPVIHVLDARGTEPANGTAALLLRPRLSRASVNDVQVQWGTLDGSAIGGLDFIHASGTATIPAGELQTDIAITLLADASVEADEFFQLVLSAPSGATLARTHIGATIVDPAYDPAVEDHGGPDNGSVPALVQPSGVTVSPDGQHVYATSDSLDAVLVFRRQPGNGALQFVTHYTATTPGFEAALLDGADDVVLSPDGAHVYVAARNSNAVVAFSRDASTGALALLGNSVHATAGVTGLQGVVALALSHDGAHLYAAARSGGSIAAFARDPATGTLQFLEAEFNGVDDSNDAGIAVVALDQPASLEVSPDGAQLYVASRFGNAVQVFARSTDPVDPAYGTLSFASVHQDGLLGIEGLGGASDLALSADGTRLYVLGESDDSIVLFDRAADGSLLQRQQWQRGGDGLPGMDGPTALGIAPDGTELYVTGYADSSLTVFRVLAEGEQPGLAAGTLVPRQTLFDDQGTLTEMGGPTALAISPDDRNIYVAANTDNAIAVFLRQAFTGVFSDGFGD